MKCGWLTLVALTSCTTADRSAVAQCTDTMFDIELYDKAIKDTSGAEVPISRDGCFRLQRLSNKGGMPEFRVLHVDNVARVSLESVRFDGGTLLASYYPDGQLEHSLFVSDDHLTLQSILFNPDGQLQDWHEQKPVAPGRTHTREWYRRGDTLILKADFDSDASSFNPDRHLKAFPPENRSKY